MSCLTVNVPNSTTALSALAPALCLAHWTITQRTIRVVLPNESEALRYKKHNPAGTAGDIIRLARKQAKLTREQLAAISGLPVYWIGRWERSRAIPNLRQLETIKKVLSLSVFNF